MSNIINKFKIMYVNWNIKLNFLITQFYVILRPKNLLGFTISASIWLKKLRNNTSALKL